MTNLLPHCGVKHHHGIVYVATALGGDVSPHQNAQCLCRAVSCMRTPGDAGCMLWKAAAFVCACAHFAVWPRWSGCKLGENLQETQGEATCCCMWCGSVQQTAQLFLLDCAIPSVFCDIKLRRVLRGCIVVDLIRAPANMGTGWGYFSEWFLLSSSLQTSENRATSSSKPFKCGPEEHCVRVLAGFLLLLLDYIMKFMTVPLFVCPGKQMLVSSDVHASLWKRALCNINTICPTFKAAIHKPYISTLA